MRTHVGKFILLTIVSIALFAVGWQVGYLRGMVDGKMSVYNTRFREQESMVRKILSSDPALSGLEIQRHGDGNVVLKGEIEREALIKLETELGNRLGASRAELAVSEIEESKD